MKKRLLDDKINKICNMINERISNCVFLFSMFLSVLSNINSVYGKGLDIRCISSEYRCHDHQMALCHQKVRYDGYLFDDPQYIDDYTGDYYARYVGSGNQWEGYSGTCYWHDSYVLGKTADTSDACINICTEYALYIDGSRIDTIEGFIRQMPVSELINLLDTVTLQKIYDPNMTSVNP